MKSRGVIGFRLQAEAFIRSDLQRDGVAVSGVLLKDALTGHMAADGHALAAAAPEHVTFCC